MYKLNAHVLTARGLCFGLLTPANQRLVRLAILEEDDAALAHCEEFSGDQRTIALYLACMLIGVA